MLKNIAIPLMLAASEAEAQRKPTRGELEDAMEADRAQEFKGLQAPTLECTTGTGTAENDLANLGTAVSSAEAALALAQADVDALKAADGAWTLANTARQDAVDAAVAAENEAQVAGLLKILDEKLEDERVKAALFVTADNAYQAGIRAQTAANTRNGLATSTLAGLATAKDNAASAVSAATNQAAKETLWREWRYCELGATVAGETLPASGVGYQQFLTASTLTVAGLPVQSPVLAAVPNPNTLVPLYCTVPAVSSAAIAADPSATPPVVAVPAAEVREQAKYYGSKTNLAAEVRANTDSGDVGSQLWTAELNRTEAISAEGATALVGGIQRTKAGAVAYNTGALKAATWVDTQRTRESTFYGNVLTSRGTAKTEANLQATNTGHSTASGTLSTPLAGMLGIAAGADGATKLLTAAATARDSTTAGAGLYLPSTRTAVNSGNAPNGWQFTWATDTAAMEAWQDANEVGRTGSVGSFVYPNASHTWNWWLKAHVLSKAVSDWHTAYGAGTQAGALALTKQTMTNQQCTKNAAGSTATTDCGCDTSAATWADQTDANAANKAACLTLCEQTNMNNLLVNKDTATPTIDNGGATMAKYEAASTGYCGAYSYDSGNSANQKCKLNMGNGSNTTVDQAVKKSADQPTSDTLDKCERNSVAKGFYDKQAAVQVAWAAVTSALHTSMVGNLDTQAGLEGAWLQAWYEQQLWVQINSELDTATGASKSATFLATKTTLDTSNVANTLNTGGATAALSTANAALTAAEQDLETVQAATAVATATTASLGTRIAMISAQLTELAGLANSGATGTLDEAAAKRLAEYNAYNTGEVAAATAAKGVADAAVQAASAAGVTPVVAAGSLTAARATADANWTQAKTDAGTAKTNLDTQLDGAVLETLRATVVTKTNEWTTQNNDLVSKEGTLATARTTLRTAEDALAAAILACQVSAYDAYRSTLEDEMVQRAADLKAIKAEMETALTRPEPGTIGARCEKALSNGTWRPQRSGELSCGSEENCCGAARVWMESGTTENAGWRTIETCQLATDTKYAYQPPRPPMQLKMPDTVEVDFACILGAQKLAAAATAAAAAIYMLA